MARNAGHIKVADILARAETAVARRAFRAAKPRITASANDIRRHLWTRAISPAAANAEFVLSFNKALADHGEAARAAAAHRRDRHEEVDTRLVRFVTNCGDGDE